MKGIKIQGNGAHVYAQQEQSMKYDDPSSQRNILQALSNFPRIPQILWVCPHQPSIGTVKEEP